MAFALTVVPHGWPINYYFMTIPDFKKEIFFGVIMATYLFPSSVSVVMYGVLYHKIKLKMTKVGDQPRDKNEQNQQHQQRQNNFGGIYIGTSHDLNEAFNRFFSFTDNIHNFFQLLNI